MQLPTYLLFKENESTYSSLQNKIILLIIYTNLFLMEN